jgi:regulator of protease activity HflC (stomatin/prohibitin superfamily)
LVLVLVGLLVSCQDISPGYVGLKAYTLGDKRGQIEEYGPGRYPAEMYASWYIFPTFVVTYVWTKEKDEGSPTDESFTFQSKEGLSIGADVGISLQVTSEKGVATKIFSTYRKTLEELRGTVIRNEVRDAFSSCASKYTVDEIIGTGKAVLLKDVEAIVRTKLDPVGLKLISLSWISSLRLPESVEKALNIKIEATQIAIQRENEVRTAEAEAQKKIAEAKGTADSIMLVATAQAKANDLLSRSLTSSILQSQWIAKWSGNVSQVSSDGSGIMIDMRNLK